MKRQCPLRVSSDGGRKGEEGKGAAGPKVRATMAATNKGSDGKRDDGTAPGGEAQQSSSTTSAATTGSTTEAGFPTASTASGSKGSAGEIDDFLKNATQILKMMTEKQGAQQSQGPSMKMLKKAIRRFENRLALVDSGATHPLREARPDEWAEAPEVDVVIAGDGVTTMRQNTAGTLLTEPQGSGRRPQTIVPVGNLIGLLGYELIWSKKKCVLRVNEALALDLIAKIEQEKLTRLEKAMEDSKRVLVRAMKVEKDPAWEKNLKKYVEFGKFEDGYCAISSMPWATDVMNEDLVRAISDIPHTEKEAWDLMMALGFNRRMRKRMMHKDWIVRFYSGKRSYVDKMFKMFENNGTMVLDIDVMRWIAGTFAAIPKGNTFEHALRVVVVNEVAKVGRRVMCEMADVPDDGAAMCLWASSQSEEDESSTIWLHKWFRQWIAHSFLDVMHFDQGAFGHSLRRPTTMATNLDVVELRGAQDRRTEWPTKGVCWASWAPMMVRVLVQGMKRWKQRPGWYTRMVRALKAADRKAWEKHLANDHLPHRADCLQCIHNSTGRPHRKCLHRDCYVLSADTLGPVRVAGPKGEKYAVVFTYQFPKLKMMPEDQPIKEEELVGWDLDAKAREEAGGIGELEVDMDVEFPEECELGLEEEKNGKAEELPDLDTKASTSSTTSPSVDEKIDKAKEDWWEFREAEGILVRHHVATRLQLFRPTKANGCPVPPAKLEPTRVTEVKYVGGGAEMETSDWHGYQSGARSLDKRWTGATTFKISQAEVAEEEDVLEKDEKSWEALIGDLTKPVEMETIYMVYPVRNRRGGDVMLAVQEAVLRLKLLGFPVARLHSDRGSEFASKGLRKWLLERDIFHTRSESLVPQTNGAAERGVRWFKTKAKVLLAEANVAVKYWTLAMQHASNRQIYYKLGLSKPPLLPFGTTVMIRRKVFGNNKKYDLTDRWEQGIYLGLSDTIKGGAIVLRPTGILTETLNLRAGVVDPRRLLQDPVEGGEEGGIEEADSAIIDLPEPDHRLRGKHKPPELRALRLEDEGTSVLDEEEWSMMTVLERQEAKAREFYEKGMFDLSACGEVLQELCIDGRMRTQGRGTEATSMILGAYVHGGIRGVSAQGRKRPWLMRYLNAVLRKKVKEDLGEEGAWTTVGVFRAADIPPHRDQRNRPMSLNYAVEIGGTQSGGLWVSRRGDVRECRGGGYARDLQQELPDGRVADGTLYNINQKAIAFDPKGEHAYMKPEVERWVLVGFTPLGVEKLMLPSQKILGSCGFPLSGTGVEVPPDSPDEEVESDGDEWYSFDSEESQFEEELENRARVLRCVLQEEIEDVVLDVPESDEYLQRLEYAREVCERDLQELDGQALRRIAKVSPGEAKNYEVEPLLQSLQAPLEVVHNVSLQEVRKNVDKWVASICKEVDALISSGTIRPLSPEQTRELKACGLKVLPGKAVFTAKPPSDATSGEWFRRKCRVVVCGNFLPHGQDNVYASGTSADTLRVSIAYAILRQWTAGGTDISNAFTLAPMPENLLYGVLPPSIVVLAGAAKPGETWKIERVLYGLREAPRLWSLFRNDRLQSARIDYEGRVLILCNLDTDENLWRVCYEDQPEETAGLMLIYVDDILVLSMTGIIKCIYKWLIAEWKCSALEMLSDGALRFLGVELRLQGEGIHMSQAGYVRDLLRQHGVEEQPGKPLTVPCSREWLQDEDTEDEGAEPEEATVRMAQKVTGEALWLSTRSRPELAHSVACMASKALRKPLRALEISKRVMQYLSKTADYGLLYQVGAEALDVSWHRIDSSAAQGLASEAPGTWKTRAMQKADIGTKGFDLPKFKELICLWGIVPYGAETTGLAMRALRATTTSGVLLFVILCLMLIRGAEGSKDDLPLDGSVEFYGMIVVCILAGVAVWEGIKKSLSFIRGQWMGCQKKKKKLERLRNRAQAAVQEEIQRQADDDDYDAHENVKFNGGKGQQGDSDRWDDVWSRTFERL
ncbi:Copia protein [Symbiodinium microadriaticum]|uniref:Copia protein n=1 Tax=Symbiodinium microadriaticum TaxID=2951 RepID=A0A1Q9D8U6_SYMMI|nr:Copia protein [Symbiodinium microadriaticum]